MIVCAMRQAVICVLLALLFGCAEQTHIDEITQPGRTVTPRGTDTILLASETDVEEPGEDAPSLELKVRLPEEYVPSQSVSTNLDINESEEQIIVFKRRDDPEDLIRILVVTFDPVRNNWIRAWEGATDANNNRSFSVYTDDLVGNHEQEIVCFGINSNGEQTLNVFRRTDDALGLGLSYTPILGVAADVRIEIQESPRSEAYESMQTFSGVSFPIFAERRNLESDNVFDTVKTTFFWDFTERRYVEGIVEHISGEVIEDSRLADLFAGDATEFEAFLSGPWFRSSVGGDDQLILFFGTRERNIVFHRVFSTGNLQQSFRWDDSVHPVSGRGVQLFVTNESIRTVKKLVAVTVLDVNRVSVSVQGTTDLDGTFERLTGGLQTAVLTDPDTADTLITRGLSGVYRHDAGTELVFSTPEFTQVENGAQRSGGYAIYSMGPDRILDLKFLDANRLPIDQRRYSIAYDERLDDNRITRTITLLPGEIGIGGFASSGGPEEVYEQIEIVEESASPGESLDDQ